ncbi:MAG: Mini-ribonuclease 3 [Fastidiosipilaceae bacterium]|jgi:ribonuclease-3 family protein
MNSLRALFRYDGDIRDVPVSALAYVGDAVYELYVRTHVLNQIKAGSGKLHRLSVHFVQASFQARALGKVMDELTEEERAIFKRGRNSDPGSIAKHADPLEYRLATGLETLIGWLFLLERFARVEELMSLIVRDDQEKPRLEYK